MNKTGRNKHEWGVVFQCKDPYEVGGRGYLTKRFMNALALSLKATNPVYYVDSNTLFEVF